MPEPKEIGVINEVGSFDGSFYELNESEKKEVEAQEDTSNNTK